MPRLLHELAVGRGDGSYARLLTRLAKLDLLAIDDWMIAPLRDAERRDLTRSSRTGPNAPRPSSPASCPWPTGTAVIGDANQADAICDRLLHDAHRIELKGPLDATDARSAEDPHPADDMSIPTPAPTAALPRSARSSTPPVPAGGRPARGAHRLYGKRARYAGG